MGKNSNKFSPAPSSTNSDLWKWGGKPLGYDIQSRKIYLILAPAQWYYPAFMSNATPILINGTALLKNPSYIPPDFMSPDFADDPWYLTQLRERPVVVVYPAPVGKVEASLIRSIFSTLKKELVCDYRLYSKRCIK